MVESKDCPVVRNLPPDRVTLFDCEIWKMLWYLQKDFLKNDYTNSYHAHLGLRSPRQTCPLPPFHFFLSLQAKQKDNVLWEFF